MNTAFPGLCVAVDMNTSERQGTIGDHVLHQWPSCTCQTHDLLTPAPAMSPIVMLAVSVNPESTT